ncbi:MAG TPA: hypothetical protein VKV95_15625 [Terriglobia bacterium]|nr:hypothetical protein [Terriglobia bacterium]
MAGRQRATFQKRQKEVKRLEKQRQKAEKRAARKLEKTQPHTEGDMETMLPFEDDPDNPQTHSELPS